MALWSAVVSGLLGKVAPKVADYYIQKSEGEREIELERLRGKLAWEQAQTRRAEASEGRDHEWELQSMLMHSKGWKDDWVLVVVSVPLVLSFTPWHSMVADGFARLEETPVWYQTMVVTIYLAIYGVRWWRRKQAVQRAKNGHAEEA